MMVTSVDVVQKLCLLEDNLKLAMLLGIQTPGWRFGVVIHLAKRAPIPNSNSLLLSSLIPLSKVSIVSPNAAEEAAIIMIK